MDVGEGAAAVDGEVIFVGFHAFGGGVGADEDG